MYKVFSEQSSVFSHQADLATPLKGEEYSIDYDKGRGEWF